MNAGMEKQCLQLQDVELRRYKVMYVFTLQKCRHYSHSRSDGGSMDSSSRPVTAAAAIANEVEPFEGVPVTLNICQPLPVLVEQSGLEGVHRVRRERLVVVLDGLGDVAGVPFVGVAARERQVGGNLPATAIAMVAAKNCMEPEFERAGVGLAEASPCGVPRDRNGLREVEFLFGRGPGELESLGRGEDGGVGKDECGEYGWTWMHLE
jgi:hypothetical protein